jgi:hypothetical protein
VPNVEGEIAMTTDERIARLEAKVFPPDCPTRWRRWLVWLDSRSQIVSTGDVLGHRVPMFEGVAFKVCPFCGAPLPHKDDEGVR